MIYLDCTKILPSYLSICGKITWEHFPLEWIKRRCMLNVVTTRQGNFIVYITICSSLDHGLWLCLFTHVSSTLIEIIIWCIEQIPKKTHVFQSSRKIAYGSMNLLGKFIDFYFWFWIIMVFKIGMTKKKTFVSILL